MLVAFIFIQLLQLIPFSILTQPLELRENYKLFIYLFRFIIAKGTIWIFRSRFFHKNVAATEKLHSLGPFLNLTWWALQFSDLRCKDWEDQFSLKLVVLQLPWW